MSQLAVPILPRGPFYRAPASVATTISIRATDDTPPYKVTKIRGYKRGGFALLSPYHAAKRGVLTKTLHDYQRGGVAVGNEASEAFSAGDRVKLSYHLDGFVQFSGEQEGRIVSGRDPVTLEAKGLGITTNPMSAPVMTGPAVGIILWGLEDFGKQAGKARGDALTFSPDDFVYDHCDESTWGSYGIEFFIFGMYFQPYVRQIGRTQFEMPIWHNQYHGKGGPFVLKVVRLGTQPFFLGAVCFRRPRVGFDAPSGWSISSPGALAKGPLKAVLHAFYPSDGWPKPSGTLDFDSWQQTRPEDENDPQFARDYGAVIERLEAELALQVGSQVPTLALLRDGAGLLAEILEGTALMLGDPEDPPEARRIAATTVAINAMRAARGCALLLSAGYTREALATFERLKAAHRLARILRSDPDGELARRFVGGSDLRDLQIETLEPDPEATAVLIGHLPPPALIETPAGPQRGFGFVGPANIDDTRRITLTAVALLVDVAEYAGRILRADSSTASLEAQERALRSAVKTAVDAWAAAHAETPVPESPLSPQGPSGKNHS